MDEVRIRTSLLRRAYRSFVRGDPDPLSAELEKLDIDLIVLHKTVPERRQPIDLDDTIVWMPFFVVRHDLIKGRQIGPFVDVPVSSRLIWTQRQDLVRMMGQPIHEDSSLIVFTVE